MPFRLSNLMFCVLAMAAIITLASQAFCDGAFRPDAWDAAWIQPETRTSGKGASTVFRRSFDLEALPFRANAIVTGQPAVEAFVNGVSLGRMSGWMKPEVYDATLFLKVGRNEVEIRTEGEGSVTAVHAELVLWKDKLNFTKIVTDKTWTVSAGGKDVAVKYAPSLTPTAGPAWGPLRYVYGGPVPDVSLVGCEAPKAAVCGSRLDVRLLFSGDPVEFGAKDVELCLMKDGVPRLCLPEEGRDGARWSFSIPRVPEWLGAGEFGLAWRRSRTSEKWHASGVVAITGGQVKPSGASVVRNAGIPWLAVDGKPISMLGGKSRYPQFIDEEIAAWSKAGVNLQIFDYLASRDWVEKAGRSGFKNLDEQAFALLNACPDAKILIYACVVPPQWWLKANSQEEIAYADPIPEADKEEHPLRRLRNVSMASEKYRVDGAKFLSDMVKHIVDSPYGSRVVGVAVVGGRTTEWLHWGSSSPMPKFSDYSPCMRKRFEAYLRRKYDNDVRLLRKAWSQEGVSFESAAPPSKEEWLEKTDTSPFRVNQRQADYLDLHSDVVADTIGVFAKAVKSASNGRMLSGAFYGYLLYLPRHTYMPMTGHLATKRLLENPDIDILVSPQNYNLRGPSGDAFPMDCLASVRLHGKVWLTEADTRTHLAVESQMEKSDRCLTPEASVNVIRRDALASLSQGVGMYWYSIGQPTRVWFTGELIGSEMKWAQSLFAAAAANPPKAPASMPRLSVFVDEDSCKYLSPSSNILRPLLHEQIQTRMGKLGVPWDCYLSSDLPAVAESCDVLVFANQFTASPSFRALAGKLRAGGKSMVWLYAPGFVDSAADPEAMSKLTGMALSRRAPGSSLDVTLSNGVKIPASKDLAGIISFAAIDPDMEVLGRYDDGSAAIAIKRSGGASVFVGTPFLSPEGWAPILKSLGFRPVSEDGDIVYATNDWICVHGASEGDRTLKMPMGWGEVSELFSKKIYPVKDGDLKFHVEKGKTYLFTPKREGLSK